jgi:hypothetical protein
VELHDDVKIYLLDDEEVMREVVLDTKDMRFRFINKGQI